MSAGQQPPAGAGADTDLLLRMRKATRRAHHVANALILSKLVVVLTDQKLYAHALATFLPVYEQLEALQARHKDVPGLDGVIAAVAAIPSRAAAMRADLQHLLGPDWAREVQPSPAAQAYAAHLQRLSDEDPVLLLAYVYSMQIPILLGFLGQRIQRTLQLPDTRGLAFFTVENKADKLAALRAAVTEAGRAITPKKQQQLVNEAVVQFTLNNSVVAGFRLGWHPVAAAAWRGVAAVPRYATLLLLSLLLALVWRAWHS